MLFTIIVTLVFLVFNLIYAAESTSFVPQRKIKSKSKSTPALISIVPPRRIPLKSVETRYGSRRKIKSKSTDKSGLIKVMDWRKVDPSFATPTLISSVPSRKMPLKTPALVSSVSRTKTPALVGNVSRPKMKSENTSTLDKTLKLKIDQILENIQDILKRKKEHSISLEFQHLSKLIYTMKILDYSENKNKADYVKWKVEVSEPRERVLKFNITYLHQSGILPERNEFISYLLGYILYYLENEPPLRAELGVDQVIVDRSNARYAEQT